MQKTMKLTSPLAPLKRHLDSHPRIPKRRVKLNDQTEPPESEHNANAALPVHFRLRTPLFGVITSVRTRIVSPVDVSIIIMHPLANPASNRVLSSLNAKLDTDPWDKCS